jgi:hypothetical protein
MKWGIEHRGFLCKERDLRACGTCCVGRAPLRGHVLSAKGRVLSVAKGYLLSLGSRESRRPSPSRLNPSTVNMMASPGKSTMCGAVNTA